MTFAFSGLSSRKNYYNKHYYIPVCVLFQKGRVKMGVIRRICPEPAFLYRPPQDRRDNATAAADSVRIPIYVFNIYFN